MPGPFPGMDPYLERPSLWKGVHDAMVYRALEDLQPRLRPRYVAVYEGRLVLLPLDRPSGAEPFRSGWSDVSVVEAPRAGAATATLDPVVADGVAIPEWIEEPELRTWHTYLEIREPERGEVVTVIDFLSPWNKSPGEGLDDYRTKQRALLLSRTNLVEVDLLRSGAHAIAAPLHRTKPSDYRVCIHRVARPSGFAVIRFGVRDPLPRVGIPLRGEEPDVVLDLPSVFARVYETGDYDRLVDYTAPATPPLEGPDSEWADAVLSEAGLR